MSNNNIKYSIDLASKHSGLAKNTIRAWENRFNFLHPERTGSKRRLYSEHDIEKLRLLAIATQNGHKISTIYSLPIDDLKKIIRNIDNSLLKVSPLNNFNEIIAHIKNYNEISFRKSIDDALVSNSKPAFVSKFLIPLINYIGELWRTGELRISQEHFASSIIISILYRILDTEHSGNYSRKVIITTPSGQRHEIGALVASVLLASIGWKVIYLGVDLPAEEIAFAAKSVQSDAVILSAIFQSDISQTLCEIEKLTEYLPETKIIVGSGFLNNDIKPKKNNLNFVNQFDELIEMMG